MIEKSIIRYIDKCILEECERSNNSIWSKAKINPEYFPYHIIILDKKDGSRPYFMFMIKSSFDYAKFTIYMKLARNFERYHSKYDFKLLYMSGNGEEVGELFMRPDKEILRNDFYKYGIEGFALYKFVVESKNVLIVDPVYTIHTINAFGDECGLAAFTDLDLLSPAFRQFSTVQKGIGEHLTNLFANKFDDFYLGGDKYNYHSWASYCKDYKAAYGKIPIEGCLVKQYTTFMYPEGFYSEQEIGAS